MTISITAKEFETLLNGAIKGNIVYGSVASTEGKVTADVIERLETLFAVRHGRVKFRRSPTITGPLVVVEDK